MRLVPRSVKRWGDLDVTPIMNLMVVLVPLLLVSAEFARISIIEATTSQRGATPDAKDRRRSGSIRPLDLAVVLSGSHVTLATRDGFLPSIYYSERQRNTREPTDTYTPSSEQAPEEGELIVTTGSGEVLQCLHTRFGEALVTTDGGVADRVSVGDTVATISNPRRLVRVGKDLRREPLRLADLIAHRLLDIREKYGEVVDSNEIVIAVEPDVPYRHLVAVMDASRGVGFGEVSIARVRSF